MSEEEFSELKQSFLDRSLVKDDIYINSTPEELEAFRQFLLKCDSFDVVIDGLNIAHLPIRPGLEVVSISYQ